MWARLQDHPLYALALPLIFLMPPETGTWTSSNTTAATIDSATGVATGLSQWNHYHLVQCDQSLRYTCGHPNVNCCHRAGSRPNIRPLAGMRRLCNIALRPDNRGSWSSNNTAVGTVAPTTGLFVAVTAGTVTITYTVSNICGAASATKTITVNAAPATITGTTNICPGSITALGETVVGGMWNSSNTIIATVSGTGIVTGNIPGTATISYTLPGGCSKTINITVIAPPTVAAITGPATMCAGNTIHLADATAGGAWSSSNTAVATVDPASGTTTGVTGGTATISYTITYTCGTLSASKIITVTTQPLPITGPDTLCLGITYSYTNTVAAGVWSSSDTTVLSIGAVTGSALAITTGSSVITYATGVNCSITDTVTVFSLPTAGIIASNLANSFCIGNSIEVTDTTEGGVWSISNGNALLANDTVTAVSPGMDTITYTLTNMCGTAVAVFTVNIAPPLPHITGDLSICKGDTAILSDSLYGGMWQGGGPAVILMSGIHDSGIVIGVSVGTAIITYQMDLGCVTYTTVTVNALPYIGDIHGQSSACKGAVLTFVDSATGGRWSSGNTQ